MSIEEQKPSLDRLVEEYLTLCRNGIQPSVKEYCRRHSDHSEDLQAILPALVAVEGLKPKTKDDRGASTGGVPLIDAGPDQVGQYRILRELGRGGMGVVYEAEQETLGRRVALKLIRRPSRTDTKQILRFEAEARSAAKLHHTNIVPVFDVGADEQFLYYAMQLIPGQSLDVVIQDLRRLKGRETEAL